MEIIRIGILGYGNLGKAVEKMVKEHPDIELAGIYSRRKLNHPLAKPVDRLCVGEPIDVLILCGGSATDLPQQTPEYARLYNVVDSFDHHQQIRTHYKRVDEAAKKGRKLALVSCGWDPGLFSIMRALFTSILPESNVFTFWGRGISQGHSDAIRRIKGVKDARQYTVPLESAMEAAKMYMAGGSHLEPGKMHRRECYVVAEAQADLERIAKEIKTMPDYFADYETTVHFITQEKLHAEHSGFPHGGTVIGVRPGSTGIFQLNLSSNPDFTAGILISYSKAVYRMWKEGEIGCRTVLEIPLQMLCEDMFIHM